MTMALRATAKSRRALYQPLTTKDKHWEISNTIMKGNRPILLTIFSIFILCSTLWWFGKLISSPEIMNKSNNILYSLTKFAVLLSSVGMLLLRKWGVYLYAVAYIITCILFFVLEHDYNSSKTQQYLIGAVVIVVSTVLLYLLFKKSWNKIN